MRLILYRSSSFFNRRCPLAIQEAIHEAVNHSDILDILVGKTGVLVWRECDELTVAELDGTTAMNVCSVFVAPQEPVRNVNNGGCITNIDKSVPIASASLDWVIAG